jgi:hypothetical protein
LSGEAVQELIADKVRALDFMVCQSCECVTFGIKQQCFHCDYEWEPTEVLRLLSRNLSEFPSKDRWLSEMLALAPDAGPLDVIGAYNSVPLFGRALGWLSVRDVENAIERVKCRT